MTDKLITIIPARYGSTRFPGKPMADLLGKPMIQRVVEQASSICQRVVVATDDERIYSAVDRLGIEVVMTSRDHQSGTERCLEAYNLVGAEEEIMLNLQGDEPFIRRGQIESLIRAFDDKAVDIATLGEIFDGETSDERLFDPNIVKLVRDSGGRAMYFSRSAIPYLRGIESHWCRHHRFVRHIGVYAFRTRILEDIKLLSPSNLEVSESLEQLRWLGAGLKIQVVETHMPSIGIDTPADLERAREYLLQLEARTFDR